jgi:hypothetical protein
MRSTIGRPRVLSEEQIKVVLAWRVRYLFWRALRRSLKSQRQLAQELGVSQSTISYVMRNGGRYKTRVPKE